MIKGKITRKHVVYALTALLGIAGLIGISQLSQTYSGVLETVSQELGLIGVFSYIAITVLSIVVPPIGAGFLIPVVANSWGPFAAAAYSIIGWTIGSVIAFFISRRYGLRLVKHFETVQKMRSVAQAIPEHHTFWIMVLLRMALPVDLLSYAIGIFTSVRYSPFFWSTVLGITPFAFIFAYATTASLTVQVLVFSFGSLVFFSGMYYVYSIRKAVQSGAAVEEKMK